MTNRDKLLARVSDDFLKDVFCSYISPYSCSKGNAYSNCPLKEECQSSDDEFNSAFAEWLNKEEDNDGSV